MTPLQQTALDFCQECLGWSEVAMDGTNFAIDGDAPVFDAGDLNVVMEAVRDWCSKNGLFLSTCTMPTLKTVSAQVFRHDVRVEAEHPDFGQALMSACLEAHRKLKGITHE